MSSATPGHAAKERARYHRRRAAGLCGGCGREPAAEGRARCATCLAKVRASVTHPEGRVRRNVGVRHVLRDLERRMAWGSAVHEVFAAELMARCVQGDET